MSETVLLAQTLPEFNGDLGRWNQDTRVLQEALRNPRGYEYEAQLPEVIGYLTDDEVETIKGWQETQEAQYYYLHHGGASTPNLTIFANELPDMYRTITSDVETVSEGRAELFEIEIEKKLTPKTRFARRPGDHVDLFITSPEEVYRPVYLISDFQPTVFYEGPAKLVKRDVLMLDPTSLDRQRREVQTPAPRCAIVRLSGATVHSSPLFNEAGVRTFIHGWSALRAAA